ncbi:MAG TPA: hypothetical protein VMI92_08470 [Steroidobacteraceae bacterium]|nr:hypothetical protein [Steroidobacteraceae bacterium]
MKWISQLGFMRIGQPRIDPGEDTRVLHLFRSRVELKKAFGATQEEVQRLRDRVKQQEGATLRVQEMLQDLEERLSHPASAYTAVVYYHLREMWSVGRGLLVQFSAELAAQQEERERRQLLAEFNRRQFGLRQQSEARVQQAERGHVSGREALANLEQQLARLQRFWHYFRRRELKRRIQVANLEQLMRVQDLEGIRKEAEALRAEAPPEFPGLSIDARRLINLNVLVYSQILAERLAGGQLLTLARDANSRRAPVEDAYGDRQACERLIEQICKAREILQQRSGLPAEISKRCEQLRATARYRDAEATRPSGEGASLLEEDCWDVYRALLA